MMEHIRSLLFLVAGALLAVLTSPRGRFIVPAVILAAAVLSVLALGSWHVVHADVCPTGNPPPCT